MKTVSKKLAITSIISLATVTMTVMPAMAIESTTTGGKNSAAVCARVATLSGTGQGEITKRKETLRANFAQRLEQISKKETAVSQKVTAARQAAKNQFEERIQEMKTQDGLSTTQVAAIQTFHDSMEEAEETREAAVDKARSDYRAALSALITNHQQTLTNAANAYQEAVKAAFATAVANCGQDSNTMTTLRAAIKTARTDFKTASSATEMTRQIKELAATRNQAVVAANKAFAAAAQSSAKTLTAALEATGTSTTD